MDPAVVPTADAQFGKPVARESQTLAEMLDHNALNIEVLFGGRGADGKALEDTWFLNRDDNVTGADYQYRWVKPGVSGTPFKRADHSAIVIPSGTNSMIVFGGVNENNQPLSSVFRLNWSGLTYQWTVVTTDSGPSAR